jgi:hypothetical protein
MDLASTILHHLAGPICSTALAGEQPHRTSELLSDGRNRVAPRCVRHPSHGPSHRAESVPRQVQIADDAVFQSCGQVDVEATVTTPTRRQRQRRRHGTCRSKQVRQRTPAWHRRLPQPVRASAPAQAPAARCLAVEALRANAAHPAGPPMTPSVEQALVGCVRARRQRP